LPAPPCFAQAEQLCKARAAENQELMGMCNQLLQQQEAVATTQPAGA
jgi:predicted amidohydrolase